MNTIYKFLVFIHASLEYLIPVDLPPHPENLVSACLPHLLVTVLLERWLFVALLPLYSLFLFLFGLRGQHELLSYLLLRDELGDRTRFPGRRERGEDRRREDRGGGGGEGGCLRFEGKKET